MKGVTSVNKLPSVMGSQRKFLVIVDDEQSYLDLLEQVLPAVLRCPVRTFTCPLAALGVLDQLDLGFLVTDYDMPQLNGLDFLFRARRLAPGVPLAMVTGQRMRLTVGERTRLPELKAVLHKPLDWRRLVAVIESHWTESYPLAAPVSYG